jgi:general secretion pathway protein K
VNITTQKIKAFLLLPRCIQPVSRLPRAFTGEDGIALITTLLITAVLVTVIVEFIFSVFIQTSRVENFRDSVRAGVLAQNGVTVGSEVLEEILRLKPYMTIGPEGLKFSQREGQDFVLDLTVFDETARVSTRVVYTATGLANDRIDGVYARLLKVLGLDERLRERLPTG